MKSKIIIILLLVSVAYPLHSQSIIEEAKYLARLDDLLTKRNGVQTVTNEGMLTAEQKTALAREVLNLIKTSPLQSQPQVATQTTGRSGANNQGFNLGTNVTGNQGNSGVSGQSVSNPELDALTLEAISEELEFILKFLDVENLPYEDAGNRLKDVPSSFSYLKPIVATLTENSGPAADLSAGLGLGSVVSISQAEILKGIADWALERAQEELMQSFLRNWLDRIEKDPLLQKIFPNTAAMLTTRPITSFFTDGDAWKAAFQQDFEQLPPQLPEIVELALSRAGDPIELKTKNEMIAGLRLTIELFEALGANKRPEEMLQLLSKKALVNARSLGFDKTTTVDRLTMASGLLVSSIQVKGGASPAFADAATLLNLSKKELEIFWKLLFSRELETFQYVFNLPTDEEAKKFYAKVKETYIGALQSKLAQISETIQALNTFRISKSGQKDVVLDSNQFHQYSNLTFDFLELGISTLDKLGVRGLDTDQLEQYRQGFFELYKHVSLLVEGVSTKQYGKTVLNTVNFLLWLDKDFPEVVLKNKLRIQDFTNLVGDTIKEENLAKVLAELDKLAQNRLGKYPKAHELVKAKLKNVKTVIGESDNIEATKIKEIIKAQMQLSDDERKQMIVEFSKGFLDLFKTSSAVHKYGTLMVGIVLAENSDEVQNAIELAAEEVGGFMVKQTSKFSVTVSFFPGIEYGWEEIDSAENSGDGSYIGATLPVGVELAWGIEKSKLLGAWGLYLQLLDLGAVLNYSLNNEESDFSNRTDFGFKEVLSPGSFLLFHAKEVPIVLGAGVSYAPSLREITVDDATLEAGALQYGLFLGVDLNVFTLHGSDSKFVGK